MKWLIPAIGALLLWGVWGAALRVVSERSPWYHVYLATNTAIVTVMVVVALKYGPPTPDRYGARWLVAAFATGLAGTLGYILLVLSLQLGGKTSIVIPLTSLYPAVASIIGVLVLGEQLSARKALGIILALVAIVLLSKE